MKDFSIEKIIDAAIVEQKLTNDIPTDTAIHTAFQKLIHKLEEREG